ncbi:hypothetical protein G973_04922 [Escherichia coli UMEA 3391-1]|uniref:hypothetical protein n=1 Tax=Escherichia coli TaxID=562 RepID=UPI00038FEC15|nr:hypothetical protein [Escherichia coli]EQZ08493.1 hypothetical protein G973_04922 [Escherichia coli UMEA 3391-1]
MKIRTDGSFQLYENLKKIDYKKENSFPPVSTLDRQITALEKKLSALHTLQQLTERTDSQWDIDNNYRDELLDYTEELDKLYDIVFLIIKKVSVVTDEEPRNAIKWVQKNEPLKFERMNGAISKEHEWIRLVANLKKHDDCRVGFINMETKTGKIIYGFFFGLIINGYFSPIAEVHKPYMSNQTAYSYNRFVNQTVSFIFKVLDELNKTLFSNYKPSNLVQQPCSSLLKIINILSSIENVFYPDEYSNKFVSCQKTKNGYIIEPVKLKYTDKYISTRHIHMLCNQGYKGYTIPYHTLIC